ncbi:MAG TPA: hypothetical protein VNS09_11340 [Solirubrobacter sp.]|nr:hypothetical protein [Solirubrobacter sp.]
MLLLGGIVAVAEPAAAAEPPEIRITPDLPTGWLTGGTYPLEIKASSSVGISRLEISAPTVMLSKPAVLRCGSALMPSPCVTVSTGYTLKTSRLQDGVGELLVRAVDRASDEWIARFPVRVDHTAPAPVVGLASLGAPGWRAHNGFDVVWATPAQDLGSALTAVRYELCPLSGVGDCLTSERSYTGTPRIDGLAVPHSGVWRLRVAMRDEAGNVDLATEASTILSLDAEPPRVELTSSASDYPVMVELQADDPDSGVAQTTIEARRLGEWRVLDLKAGSHAVGVLDDGTLPDGLYEIRGRAIDAVGNERTVSTLASGSPVTVRLPLRQNSRLRSGIRTARGKLESRALLDYGARPVLRGVLADDSDRPLAGAAVEVSERQDLPGAPWRHIATVRTSAAGDFAYRARRGTARTIRLEYPGSSTTRPASAEVVLRVRGYSTLRANRKVLRNGDSVVLSGQLRGREIPRSGKLLTLQARVPGGWRTFGTARARAKDGRWSYRYVFTRTPTTARYTFRAVVPREAAYPYVAGTSSRVSVLVRGSG